MERVEEATADGKQKQMVEWNWIRSSTTTIRDAV
jgi:hypothetical protein